MQIQSIKATNYKTYRALNLDLSVSSGKSIILIGGANGGGKTTLFEAIYGALYGLNIKTASDFRKFVNDGIKDKDDQSITLEIAFTGYVLGTPKQYKLRRIYKLINNQPVENVTLDFDSTTYSYGTHTAANDRREQELEVNKIIKANLPSELSNYFLFDAMKTGDLVKENQINALIKENIQSVMGFNKYQRLKEGAAKLLSEENSKRLENAEQRHEYDGLQLKKTELAGDRARILQNYEKALAYSTNQHSEYERLLKGERNDTLTREKIKKTEDAIAETKRGEKAYNERLKKFVSTIEVGVFIPRVAALLKSQAEQILLNKKQVMEQGSGKLSDAQLRELAKELVDIIEHDYLSQGTVDVDQVITEFQHRQSEKKRVLDHYYYLDHNDVQQLTHLVESRYVNEFLALQPERTQLQQRVADMSQLEDNLESFRQQLTGDDYSVIRKYEDNERALSQLKQDLACKDDEIKKVDQRINQFDLQVQNDNDPRYELLKRLPDFFDKLSERLLEARKIKIEQRMKEYLNKNLIAYQDVIGRVELSISHGDISFKIFHIRGNEINLEQLNAASKQALMQVLLKVLYELGDYDPPVMIDTVMGVLDTASRNALLENYFPDLANQTILLSTDVEITPVEGFEKLKPYIARVYDLHRDKQEQCTTVTNDYFGQKL